MEQKTGSEKESMKGSFTSALRRLGENLSDMGYSRPISADYIRVVKHFCYWHTQDAVAREMDESRIREFLEHFASCTCPIAARGTYRLCHAALSHFIPILREMGLAPLLRKPVLPEDELLKAFREHLTKVHGAVEVTASLYSRHLRPFLQSIYAEGTFNFHEVTARDVSKRLYRAWRHDTNLRQSNCTAPVFGLSSDSCCSRVI